MTRPGPPDHQPMIMPVLAHGPCASGDCDHDHPDDCPTRGAAVCSTCTTADPDALGDVAFAVAWPCSTRRRGSA